jgi:hypothetical protein
LRRLATGGENRARDNAGGRVAEAEMKDRLPIPLAYHATPEDERLKPAKLPAWKFLLLVYFVIGGVILVVDIAADLWQRPSPGTVKPIPTTLPPSTAPGAGLR